MINLITIKPNDILYTIDDVWDIETHQNMGRISICVKSVEHGGILAHGRCWYPPDKLTDVKPDNYNPLGEDFLKILITPKPLKSGELIQKALKNEKITPEEALATYADPNNWETVLDRDPNKGCHWAWKGPVIVGYELAQFALKE